MIEKARILLANREENHPANLREARELLLSACEGPERAAAYLLLAEIMFWLGDYSDETSEKESVHGEGVEYGKQAVSLNPDTAAAHLWYAANMGSHGMARGIMSSLFYLGDIEKHGNRAIELDIAFFHAAPLRLMGRFYHQAPGWPVGKGDVSKAIEILEKAVAMGPEFYLNHLYLAEALMAKRKKDAARALLDQIINVPLFKELPLYQERIRQQARTLIRKV